MLDAPVTGGPAGAASATLTIMVGGDPGILQRVRPVLECLGSKIVHVGPNGAGQIAKACNQLALLVNAEGTAEALALAARLGLDPSLVRDVLLGGIAASRVLDVFGARMAERQFQPGMESRLYDKDLNIVLELARSVGQELPAASVVRDHLDKIMAAQHGRKDLSILIEVVERLKAVDDECRAPGSGLRTSGSGLGSGPRLRAAARSRAQQRSLNARGFRLQPEDRARSLEPGAREPGVRPAYVVMRSSLIRFPPRIASFCALLRNDAFRMKSIPTGQSKG